MKSIQVEKRDGILHYSKTWMDKIISDLTTGKYIMQFVAVEGITDAQRAFYRAVILPVLAKGAAAGSYTTAEWHEILMKKFLGVEVELDGQVTTVARSTSKEGNVSCEEFSAALEEILNYALTEHGIRIPTPDELQD